MIAVSSSGRGFRALAAYLATGRTGTEQARVAWSAARNLPTNDPQLAGTLMRATAAQNVHVGKPVYHLAIAFDPGDPVDRATMERVADRVLARLGLSEHQAVIVAHQDREHPHLHILVNRVHPRTGKAWDRWQDQPAVQQILREEERALGLRAVPGRLYELPAAVTVSAQIGMFPEQHATVRERQENSVLVDGASRRTAASVEVAPGLSAGERRTWERTGEVPLLMRARDHLAAVREASTWAEVETRLGSAGLRVERSGPGLVVTDGERYVKASRVAPDLALGRMEQRLGASFPGSERPTLGTDATPAMKRRTPGSELPLAPVDRGALRKAPAREAPPNVPPFAPEVSIAVTGLVREIGVYERRLALAGRQLEAQLGASAARARETQLGAAVARVDAAEAAFRQALAQAYRDPVAAERTYQERARTAGRADAVRTLREHPENLGRLQSVDVSRAFGLGTRVDDRDGRAAAVVAAAHAVRVVETRRELARAVVTARVQRYEELFTRRLSRLYDDAPAVRERFGVIVVDQGLKRAMSRLTRHPTDLGEFRPRALRSEDRAPHNEERGREHRSTGPAAEHVQQGLREAAQAGHAWAFARREAEALTERLDATEGALRAALERERAGAGRLGDRAVDRQRRIGTELARMPAQAALERAIGHAVRRLAPAEVRQLERLLTNPQRAVIAKLRDQVRQAVLGREPGE